jgi:restriction endonuclease S subunit
MAFKRNVGDYVTLQRGVTYKGNLVGQPGPALLGLGSIVPGGGFREGDYKTYGGECPSNIMLKPGDLFVSLKGATKDGEMIGSVARVPASVASGRLTQDTVKLEFREPNPVDSQFIYWNLRTPQYRAYCAGRARGSAVVALSREDFLSYPIPEATSVRMKLVEVFESVESKIELNRRVNATLEAVTQSIFKSLFIAGSENEMPPGWRKSTIGEEVSVVGGSTPSTTHREFWDDGVYHWATPKDLSNLVSPVLLDTERKITDAGLREIGSGLLPSGTVLLSSRAPIGYIAISEIPVAVNQGFVAMVCNKTLPNYFVRLWTKSNIDVIKARANGTTFMEISKANFRPLRVLVPPTELLDEFKRQVEPLYQRIVSNLKESRTLVVIRDALLPKLMSGELPVLPTIAT